MTAFDPLASKKEDPNFSQISGHIPNDLARQFRIICADQGLKVSEGLEQAIAYWVRQQSDSHLPDEQKGE
jgi:hypothetical protein